MERDEIFDLFHRYLLNDRRDLGVEYRLLKELQRKNLFSRYALTVDSEFIEGIVEKLNKLFEVNECYGSKTFAAIKSIKTISSYTCLSAIHNTYPNVINSSVEYELIIYNNNYPCKTVKLLVESDICFKITVSANYRHAEFFTMMNSIEVLFKNLEQFAKCLIKSSWSKYKTIY